MTPLLIKLTQSDSEYLSVLDIRRIVFINEQNVPEEIEIDEFEGTSEHFIVFYMGTPVGCGRMRKKDEYIKFERIAVLPSYRDKGIGKSLMQFMMKYAQINYPNRDGFMYSQASAIGFYEKIGWKTLGDPFIEAGIPHQTMLLKRN